MLGTVDNPAKVRGLREYLAGVRWGAGTRPGELLRYSNHGMALAGGIVERVSGVPFAEYVEREIFRPLGMRHSSLRQPPDPDLVRRIATAGTDARIDFLLPSPAGAMVGTASDMGRVLIAQLDTAGPRAKTLELMHATHWRAHPGVPGVALGWFETELGDVRALYHTGARHHFSVAWIAPSKRTGIFLVHSMRQGGRFLNLRTQVIRAFVARYFEPDSSPARPAPGRGIAGVYRPMLLGTTTIERAGYLLLDTRVRLLPDDRIMLAAPGGLGQITAEPVGDRLFEVTTGPQAGLRLGFLPNAGSDRFVLGGTLLDPVIVIRLAWWQRGFVHLILLGASCFALALASLVQGIRRLCRKRSHISLRWPWRVASGAGTAILLALGTFAVVVGTTPEAGAAEHMRGGLRIVLVWLSLAALLGAILPVGAVVAGWGRAGSVTGRIVLSLLAIAGIVSVALLWHYNLVGFRL